MISLNNSKSLLSLYYLKKLVLSILILLLISFISTISFIINALNNWVNITSLFLSPSLILFLSIHLILLAFLIIFVVEIHKYEQEYKEKLENLFLLWLIGIILFVFLSGFAFIYLITIAGISYSKISQKINQVKEEEIL